MKTKLVEELINTLYRLSLGDEKIATPEYCHKVYDILDNQNIRKVKSSFRLKSGSRVPIGTELNGDFPGGNYDGMYREDYEYVDGLGDLDECNGMTHNGTYGYYVTESFPWVINCFKGEVNSSFNK